jgi:hypothetical protein
MASAKIRKSSRRLFGHDVEMAPCIFNMTPCLLGLPAHFQPKLAHLQSKPAQLCFDYLEIVDRLA